jgi:hypothetical protein
MTDEIVSVKFSPPTREYLVNLVSLYESRSDKRAHTIHEMLFHHKGVTYQIEIAIRQAPPEEVAMLRAQDMGWNYASLDSVSTLSVKDDHRS